MALTTDVPDFALSNMGGDPWNSRANTTSGRRCITSRT